MPLESNLDTANDFPSAISPSFNDSDQILENISPAPIHDSHNHIQDAAVGTIDSSAPIIPIAGDQLLEEMAVEDLIILEVHGEGEGENNNEDLAALEHGIGLLAEDVDMRVEVDPIVALEAAVGNLSEAAKAVWICLWVVARMAWDDMQV